MLFRLAICVAALGSLSLSGCLGVPAAYAYPKISYFPATQLNANDGEVEAFLVKTTCAWHQPSPFAQNGPRREVTRLPLSADSNTISHTSVSVEAFIGKLGALCYGRGLEHDSKIVLYRPGYELIEIQPWEKRKTINWKQALDPEVPERAKDDLVAATL